MRRKWLSLFAPAPKPYREPPAALTLSDIHGALAVVYSRFYAGGITGESTLFLYNAIMAAAGAAGISMNPLNVDEGGNARV